ncbi:MAG TPA: PEP-CTERM sorting domain-containing protein [Bryobacteraceae bacterium]
MTYLPTNSSVSVDPINAPSTFSNLGNIQISCVDHTLTCPSESLPSGLTLAININQSQPDFLSGGIPVGTVVGSIAGGSSNASIQWDPGSSVTLNGALFDVTYAIVSPNLTLSPPASCYGGNCGMTSIQGLITDPVSSVPEPAISMLFASGLVAVGSVRRRKKS